MSSLTASIDGMIRRRGLLRLELQGLLGEPDRRLRSPDRVVVVRLRLGVLVARPRLLDELPRVFQEPCDSGVVLPRSARAIVSSACLMKTGHMYARAGAAAASTRTVHASAARMALLMPRYPTSLARTCGARAFVDRLVGVNGRGRSYYEVAVFKTPEAGAQRPPGCRCCWALAPRARE